MTHYWSNNGVLSTTDDGTLHYNTGLELVSPLPLVMTHYPTILDWSSNGVPSTTGDDTLQYDTGPVMVFPLLTHYTTIPV